MRIWAYGAWLRALGRVAPRQADRMLARRFCTPYRRRDQPGAEVFEPAGSVVRNGDRIPVWRGGSGPRVLMAHGWDSNAAFWEPMAGELVRGGYEVILFDMPGHGIAGGRRTNVLEMADAIQAVAAPEGRLAAVIAHSAGATAAALALRAGLPADRAVLLAPPIAPAEFIFPMARALGLSTGRAARALDAMGRSIGRDPMEADTVAAVRELDLPGLVVHDRDDRRTPWEQGRAVAGAWPRARLLSTDGLGHNRVARNEEVVREVVRFLQGDAALAATIPRRAAG